MIFFRENRIVFRLVDLQSKEADGQRYDADDHHPLQEDDPALRESILSLISSHVCNCLANAPPRNALCGAAEAVEQHKNQDAQEGIGEHSSHDSQERKFARLSEQGHSQRVYAKLMEGE